MEIAVISKKGGVGKTPFAFSIAKDLGYFLQSNDNSCIEQIYPGKAKILNKVQNIDNCVYDFGGFVESGVLDVIKKCSAVVIPCTPTYNAILRTVETISEIEPINKNIIIIATNFKDDRELEFLQSNLNDRYKKLSIFYFKNSKIVNNAINTGLSFTELYNENSLSQKSYHGFFSEYSKLLQRITDGK